MLPPRSEVRVRLVQLLEGSLTREAADEWASEQIAFYETNRELGDPGWDEGVWGALRHLFGSDMRVSDTDYLHGEVDFQAWLAEFDRSDPDGPQQSG
jgi:hypothetical protein